MANKLDLIIEKIDVNEPNGELLRENLNRIKMYIDELAETVSSDTPTVHDPVYAYQTASYNCTNAWANVPQLSITIPYNGLYEIVAEGMMIVHDDSATAATASIRLANGGTKIPGTSREGYHSDAANTYRANYPFSVSIMSTFAKDAVVTLQAKMEDGDDCAISWASDRIEGYLMYRRLK